MPLLALGNIRKRFGSNLVLDDVSLDIDAGEVVAVIGRSGSGKTTLLRCINGLETIDEGSIVFDGKPLPPGGSELRELRRHIGIVFQSLNLFPHGPARKTQANSEIVVSRRGFPPITRLAIVGCRRTACFSTFGRRRARPDVL